MVSLAEQIADFEAKGCVAGGRKWNYDNEDTSMYISLCQTLVELYMYQREIGTSYSLEFCNNPYHLASTTLEEALCEALDIVKAKVQELAKELGFVCFTVDEFDILRKGTKEEIFEMFKLKNISK